MKKMIPIFVSMFFAAAAILAAVFSANASDPLTALGTSGLQISQSAVDGTDYTYVDFNPETGKKVLTIISKTDITIPDKIFKVTVDEKGKVTYGDAGSEEPPVCENIAIEPEPDDPTPDDPTPDDPTPDDNDNPNTGVGFGIAGLTILGSSVCVTFGKQRRTKKKNSGKSDIDF